VYEVMKLIATKERMSQSLWLLIGLALLSVIGILDYVTGTELSFAQFYVLPIALVTWFTSAGLGVALAIVSAGVWLTADILAGAVYSHRFIHLWNTVIRLGFFLLTVLALRLGKTLRRERVVARSDFVTGAVNARFFRALAQREIDRSARYLHPLTVAYIDIDNFKAINDVFGHMTGDKVLAVVAHIMQQQVRKTDVVSRVGGDEFAILLPEVGTDEAKAVISKIGCRLSEEMESKGWPVTFSIGVLTFIAVPPSAEDMLSMADRVMYTVKNSGKNSVRYDTHAG
jgi:diguanylate cyclase (GGDEF)-like protein